MAVSPRYPACHSFNSLVRPKLVHLDVTPFCRPRGSISRPVETVYLWNTRASRKCRDVQGGLYWKHAANPCNGYVCAAVVMVDTVVSSITLDRVSGAYGTETIPLPSRRVATPTAIARASAAHGPGPHAPGQGQGGGHARHAARRLREEAPTTRKEQGIRARCVPQLQRVAFCCLVIRRDVAGSPLSSRWYIRILC